MINYSTSIVHNISGTVSFNVDSDFKLVGNGVSPDSLALACIVNNFLHLFVRSNGSPFSLAPVAGVGLDVSHVSGGLIDLIPFSDGSYCFVYTDNSAVYYSRVHADGSVAVAPVALNSFPLSTVTLNSSNTCLSVMADNTFVIYAAFSLGGNFHVTAYKFDQSGNFLRSGTVSQESIFAPTQGYTVGLLRCLRKPSAQRVVLVLSITPVTGSFSDGTSIQIRGISFDVTNMLLLGNSNFPFAQRSSYGTSGARVSSGILGVFDDSVVKDGIWVIQDGGSGTAPPATVLQTVHIIEPLTSTSSSVGYVDNFSPVVIAIPLVSPGANPDNVCLLGPTLRGPSVVFDPTTSDIYLTGCSPDADLSVASSVYRFQRTALTTPSNTPVTIGVSFDATTAVAPATFLPQAVGMPSSFYSLMEDPTSLQFSIIKISSSNIPPPPPPAGSTTVPTFTPPVPTIGSLAYVTSNILGMALNSVGDVALLYADLSNTTLSIICRQGNGTVVGPFTIVPSSSNISVPNPVNGLVATGDDQWFVTYVSAGGLFSARIKSDCSAFSLAPVTIVAAAVNLTVTYASTVVFSGNSFMCVFDSVVTLAMPQTRTKMFSSTGVQIGSTSTVFQAPNVNDVLQSSADFSGTVIVAVSTINSALVSPNLQTFVYSITPSPFLISNPYSFPNVAAGLISSVQAQADNLMQGVWVQCAGATAGSLQSALFQAGNLPINPPIINNETSGVHTSGLVSAEFIQDIEGNLYGLNSSSVFDQQNRYSGATNTVNLTESLSNLVTIPDSPYVSSNPNSVRVVGNADKFFVLSYPPSGPVSIIQVNRTDVPPSAAGTVIQITAIHLSPISPVLAATGPIEMLSIATNANNDIVVLRFVPVDSSGEFQPKGRLFADVFDVNYSLKASVQILNETGSNPIITKNSDQNIVYRNHSPHIVAMPVSGNFLIYWGNLVSKQGDAQFQYTVVGRDGSWNGKIYNLTAPGDSCWAARVMMLDDDRFIAFYINWIPSDTISNVFARHFNSLGPESDPVVLRAGAGLAFQKDIVAREQGGSSWLVAFSSTTDSVHTDKEIWIADSNFNVRVYPVVGTSTPVKITGFGDFDGESLWVDEGSGISLLTPDPILIFTDTNQVNHSSTPITPTLFPRATFDKNGNVYGIITGNPPSFRQMLRSNETSIFFGSLQNNGVPLFTGTNFTDAAIAGTGESMIVPVYQDSNRNTYEFVVTVQNSNPGMPVPSVNSPISFVTAFLPNGQEGVSYPSTPIIISAGAGTVTYSLLSNPPGLSIGLHTGVISGIPTSSGTFNLTVVATNSNGTFEKTYPIEIEGCTIVSGLNLVSGPTIAFPSPFVTSFALSSTQVHTATQLWTTRTIVNGTSQSAILQQAINPGVLGITLGTFVTFLSAFVPVSGNVETDIGQDASGGATVVWGGYVEQISPQISGGSIYYARYDMNGGVLTAPQVISGQPLPLARLRPRVFVFSDGTAAVVWYEGGTLNMTTVSPSGVASTPVVVVSGQNSEIAPVVTGDPNGNLFDVVFSDGNSFGFAQYDKFGTLVQLTLGINAGENITAVAAAYSPFDGLLTVALSLRFGNSLPYDYRVAMQRFSLNGGAVTSLFETDFSEQAVFGKLSQHAVIEFVDGSLILTYCNAGNNRSYLRRFDRSMNDVATIPLGISFSTGELGVNSLGLSQVANSIIWGFHDVGLLNAYIYNIDCAIVTPSLPPVQPSSSNTPGSCKTV